MNLTGFSFCFFPGFLAIFILSSNNNNNNNNILLQLRNPPDNFSFATVRGSAVEEYFRTKIEYSNLYRAMSNYGVTSANEGIEAVLNG